MVICLRISGRCFAGLLLLCIVTEALSVGDEARIIFYVLTLTLSVRQSIELKITEVPKDVFY